MGVGENPLTGEKQQQPTCKTNKPACSIIWAIFAGGCCAGEIRSKADKNSNALSLAVHLAASCTEANIHGSIALSNFVRNVEFFRLEAKEG
jgi:hypothetical protein